MALTSRREYRGSQTPSGSDSVPIATGVERSSTHRDRMRSRRPAPSIPSTATGRSARSRTTTARGTARRPSGEP